MYIVPEELRSGKAVSRTDTLKALEGSPLLAELERRKPGRLRALRAAWDALPDDTDFARLASLLPHFAWRAVQWDDETETLRSRKVGLTSESLARREFAAVKKLYAASLKLTGWEIVCHDCDAVLWRKFGGVEPPETESRRPCKPGAVCHDLPQGKKRGRGLRRVFEIPRGPTLAAVVAFLQAAQRDYPALSLFYELSEHPPAVRLGGAKAPTAVPGLEAFAVAKQGTPARSAKGQALRLIKDLIGPETHEHVPHLLVFAVGIGDFGRLARSSSISKMTDEEFIEDFEKRYPAP